MPLIKYHLLMKPMVGGSPTIINDPITIIKHVMGNLDAKLFIPLTFFIPVCVVITPALKNKITFPNAWKTRCNIAATIE